MKLPSFQRLYDQDYKDEFKDLIRQMSLSLNTGIEVVYEALNKRLSLSENIACTVKEVKIIVDSNGIPTTETIFGLDSTSVNVEGCHVIKATNIKNPNTYPTSGVFITYTQVSTGVKIQHVTGLIAGEQYNVKVVAYHQ
jgi:hypothetical protein